MNLLTSASHVKGWFCLSEDLTFGQRMLRVLFWAALLGAVETALFFHGDKYIAAWAHAMDGTHRDLIDFFRTITDLGKGAWYLWPSGIGLIFLAFLARGKDVPLPYRHLFGYLGVRALFLFGAIGISGIVANIIKPIVGRARPRLWLQEGLYGFDPLTLSTSLWKSMPSGHTTTVFALAFSLAHLYPRGRVLWFSYALVLGASRVMVNAHYLSDVVAGAVLGAVTVILFSRYGIKPLCKVIFPIDIRPEKL